MPAAPESVAARFFFRELAGLMLLTGTRAPTMRMLIGGNVSSPGGLRIHRPRSLAVNLQSAGTGGRVLGPRSLPQVSRRLRAPDMLRCRRSSKAIFRDAEAVRKAVRGSTAVVHLAAEVGGRPVDVRNRPVTPRHHRLGTAVLLEALIAEPYGW